MSNQFASVLLAYLAEGHRISLEFIRSHGCVLRLADRHLPSYKSLCFTFSDIPIICFQLQSLLPPSLSPSPALWCHTSCSSSLNLISPVPALLPPPRLLFVIDRCLFQTSGRTGGRCDDGSTHSVCVLSAFLFFFQFSMRVCTRGGRCRGTAETQNVSCNWALAVLDDASAKHPTKEAKMRI